MNKNYHNKKKEEYIIQKLSSTQIDKVWHPIIADIIMRRQFEYELSDEIFERDIDTFIQNVDKIEIEDMKEKNVGAAFAPGEMKIIVNKELFEKDGEFFLEMLTHECMHAMNFINKDNYKTDRTFDVFRREGRQIASSNGIMELFTECEANELVYNKSRQNKTRGYSKMTPYMDFIAASFGVSKKDLLSAAIKGRKELQDLLNEHIPNKKMENGENQFFNRMVRGINEIGQMYIPNMIWGIEGSEEYAEESVGLAIETIHNLGIYGINVRISNLSTDDMQKFKEQFDRIKVEQKIISEMKHGEDSNTNKVIKDLKKLYDGIEKTTYTKLWYIQEILKNENKTESDKAKMIKSIQNKNSSEKILEVKEFMGNKGILLPEELVIEIPEEALEKYNEEYTSSGMEWDNTKIIEYIKQHENELKGDKISIFQKLQQKIKNLFSRKKTKLLPESMQQTKEETSKEESASWDLVNWGKDKEEFSKENEKIVEGYLNRESEGKTHDITLDEHDGEEIE